MAVNFQKKINKKISQNYQSHKHIDHKKNINIPHKRTFKTKSNIEKNDKIKIKISRRKNELNFY